MARLSQSAIRSTEFHVNENDRDRDSGVMMCAGYISQARPCGIDSIREGCELYRLDATLASSAHAPLLHTALVSDEGKAVVKHVDEIVGPG